MTVDSSPRSACARADALARRLEQGAQALAEFVSNLTDPERRMTVPCDGRRVGVIVHHVAAVYPLEIELTRRLAAVEPIIGVTMADVHAMHARHAKENSAITREKALALLARNSGVAVAATRALGDQALANAAPVSLYGGAPVTCRFLLEDHAVRHGDHHLSVQARTLNP